MSLNKRRLYLLIAAAMLMWTTAIFAQECNPSCSAGFSDCLSEQYYRSYDACGIDNCYNQRLRVINACITQVNGWNVLPGEAANLCWYLYNAFGGRNCEQEAVSCQSTTYSYMGYGCEYRYNLCCAGLYYSGGSWFEDLWWGYNVEIARAEYAERLNVGKANDKANSSTSAADSGGNAKKPCAEMACGGPVNVTNGNMYFTHSDYAAGGLSNTLSFDRTYNNQSDDIGIFGRGWSTSFDEVLKLSESDENTLSVTFGDGRIVVYTRASSESYTYYAVVPNDKRSRIEVTGSSPNYYVLFLTNGESHAFAPDGKLVGKAGRDGLVTVFTYNGSGRLSTITSPVGLNLTFNYDSAGHVTSVVSGANHTVDSSYNPGILGTVATYQYNNEGLLSQANYPNGTAYKYEYSYKSGTQKYYVATVKDVQDKVMETHQYDDYGRATTSEVGDIESTTGHRKERYLFSYTSSTETQITDGLGRIINVTYDGKFGRNVITSITGPYYQTASATMYKTYDDSGNLIVEENQQGYKTNYAYDSYGNVASISTPMKATQYTYNSYGQVLTESDGLGSATYTYDNYNNLLSVTDSTGATTSYTYNGSGLVLTKTDPLGHITYYGYDQYGNVLNVTNYVTDQTTNTQVQVRTEYLYDIRGRVTRITDALNHQTNFSYNDSDRYVLITYADGATEKKISNLNGQIAEVK
jgi:YD repeat-containing protein